MPTNDVFGFQTTDRYFIQLARIIGQCLLCKRLPNSIIVSYGYHRHRYIFFCRFYSPPTYWTFLKGTRMSKIWPHSVEFPQDNGTFSCYLLLPLVWPRILSYRPFYMASVIIIQHPKYQHHSFAFINEMKWNYIVILLLICF